MTKASQLPDGVHVIERGWLSANNVLLLGHGTTALVDSGYSTHTRLTIQLVEQQLAGRSLDLLVNTHLHSDHCGGNAGIQVRYKGVKTLIPSGEAEAVNRWDCSALSFQATGQQCPRFRHDGVIEHGGEVRLGSAIWQVHGAPGHDPHSILLFEPQTATLISADALWENGFGVIFPELIGDPSFDEVAATLERIEELKPKVVVPGHGTTFDDVAGALATSRRRLESFITNPTKHAIYALKVLLKFRLLEVQRVRVEDLLVWAGTVSYFELIRRRFFADLTVNQLISEILTQLQFSNSAIDTAGWISNR